MAYASPSTQVTGTLITSTHWAQLVNNDKFFHGPPTARFRAVAKSSAATTVWTPIVFDTKDWDTNSILSTTSALIKTKLIAKTAGVYQVNVSCAISASSLGAIRALAIQKNTTSAGLGHEATVTLLTTALAGGTPYDFTVSQMVALTTGQYVRAEFKQDSGGTLNTSTVSNNQSRMSILWVSS